MRVWTSSESMVDVHERLRSASREVERELNAAVGSESYGTGVIEWALIYIIMDQVDPNFPEVRRYKKRKQEVEFRLKVDHQAFKEAGALAQRKLLSETILRSIDLSRELKISDFDAERFKKDVVQALKKNEWV
jgi:Immunity protein 44